MFFLKPKNPKHNKINNIDFSELILKNYPHFQRIISFSNENFIKCFTKTAWIIGQAVVFKVF